jgi:hypothetical protein
MGVETSDFVNPNPISKGIVYWEKLRKNWKVAVKNELKSDFTKWEENHKKNAFWRMIAENYKVN